MSSNQWWLPEQLIVTSKWSTLIYYLTDYIFSCVLIYLSTEWKLRSSVQETFRVSLLASPQQPLLLRQLKYNCQSIITCSRQSTMWVPYLRQSSSNFSQVNGQQLPPMRTRPYRNARIIMVIQDLYFSGGMGSFLHHFNKYVPIPSFWECKSVLPLKSIIVSF